MIAREFLRQSAETEFRLPGRPAPHFHVLPAEMLSDTGPEGLRNRLLRRPSRGIVNGRLLLPRAILPLPRRKDALKEALGDDLVVPYIRPQGRVDDPKQDDG